MLLNQLAYQLRTEQ